MKTISLVYLARPVYGGFVTYTAHLFHRLLKNHYDVCLYKIRKRTENSARDYGYGVKSWNICVDDMHLLANPVITAVDRHSSWLLADFPDGAMLTLHDPSELNEEIIEQAKRFRIIVIRKTMKKYLKKKYGLESRFMYHPFFRFKRKLPEKRVGSCAISRIDWDKGTDTIMEANEILKKKERIEIWGVHNRAYVKRRMDWDKFFKVYKGRFDKTFSAVERILRGKKFMVDMSAIKNDGCGSQYTFLEAIHCGVVLILNTEWFAEGKGEFIPGINCIAVSDASELAAVIKYPTDASHVLRNAKKLLVKHLISDLPYKV